MSFPLEISTKNTTDIDDQHWTTSHFASALVSVLLCVVSFVSPVFVAAAAAHFAASCAVPCREFRTPNPDEKRHVAAFGQ